jgi:hypothetical protein
MPVYYFNLSCETTYRELIQVGVEAESPEKAEQVIDEFVQDEDVSPKEYLVGEREILNRDYTSVKLIEGTELKEPDNDDNIDNDPTYA